MKYISVASGIEAATMAWEPLGWKRIAFAEFDGFPSAVLAHYYPETPNYGDMNKFQEWPDAEPDVLVGGTPCQSFSIAGLRKGLDDPRGNLTLIYLEIARRYQPRWLVWENVPGVLSHDDGRSFGTFLGGMAELGYGFAYRVLDAQYFGLAQRRKRVFVVGHLGDWRRAAAVLFERESLSGNPAPSREKRKDVAPTISARTEGGGGLGTDAELDGALIAFGGNRTSGPIDAAAALSAHSGPSGRQDFSSETFVVGTLQHSGKAAGSATQQDAESGLLVTHALRADGFDASEDGTGRGTPIVPVIGFNSRQDPIVGGDLAQPLDASHPVGNAIAFAQNQRREVRVMEVAGALAADAGMTQQTYVAERERETASIQDSRRLRRRRQGLPRPRGPSFHVIDWRRPASVHADAGTSAHAQGVRAPTGFPGRLHTHPVPQQTSQRRPALQGLGQQHGGSRDALDWRTNHGS